MQNTEASDEIEDIEADIDEANFKFKRRIADLNSGCAKFKARSLG